MVDQVLPAGNIRLTPVGPRGNAGPSAYLPAAPWATGLGYVAGPPASTVTIGNGLYVCAASHTSTVFATDLAAGNWTAVLDPALLSAAVTAAAGSASAAAQNAFQFDTLTQAQGATYAPYGQASVNKDGANNGTYAYVSGALVRQTTATISALDFRVASFETIAVDTELPEFPIAWNAATGQTALWGNLNFELGFSGITDATALMIKRRTERLTVDPKRSDQRNPDRSDGASRGYAVGALWVQGRGLISKCTSNTDGAAQWQQFQKTILPGDVVTRGRQAWYGLDKQCAAWAGSAVKLQRSSDGAQLDVGFLASGRFNLPRARSFSKNWSDTLSVITEYDQSGNGNHKTYQSSYGGVNLVPPTYAPPLPGGFPNLSKSGAINYPDPSTGNGQGTTATYAGLVIPTSVTGSTRGFSLIVVGRVPHITNPCPFIQITNTGTVSFSPCFQYSDSSARFGMTIQNSNVSRGLTKVYPPSNRLGVYAVTSGTTGSKIYHEDDVSQSFSALTLDTWAGGISGTMTADQTGGVPNRAGYHDQYSSAIYNVELTTAEVLAINEAAYAYGEIDRQQRGGSHLFIGDSITKAAGVNWFQGYWMQMRPITAQNNRAYNVGQGGTTFAYWLQGTITPTWSSCFDPLGRNVVTVALGTNDIVQNISLADLQSQATQFFALVRTTAPAGTVIGASTILPRLAFANTPAWEAVRVAYNAWLRSNWWTLNVDYLIDPDVDSIMGSGASTPWYANGLSTDGATHPNALGDQQLARIHAAAFDAYIALAWY